MGDRPYTILSCSVSLDGYLDGPTRERLVLSNEDDLARVDEVRAGCDAILVGAATVRNDNPRLVVRGSALRRERARRGQGATPVKVTITNGVSLDPCSHFFTTGETEKLVYCPSSCLALAQERLGEVATVVDGGPEITVSRVAEDLHERGVRRLMVEGGGQVHTQFLTADAVDELQLVIAPFFVGDSRAHRFVGDGVYPWHPGRRAQLAETRRLGDVVLLRYAMSPRFREGP